MPEQGTLRLAGYHVRTLSGIVVEELALGRGAHYAWEWMHAARHLLTVAGFSWGLAVLGCAGPDAAARSQLDEFRRDIDRIQADNDKLNDRLTRLEAGSVPVASSSAARQPASMRIDGDGRKTSEDTASGAEDGSGDDQPTVIRAEGRREPSVKMAPAGGGREDQAAQAYEDALELVKKKKYDEALEALAGYLVRYPGDANADNAMYWRGECYYAKGDYVRAAEQFEGVVTRFPNGNKVPDALLKLGLSQRAMGDRDKARETFDRLRKSYPSAEAVKKIPRE